MNAVFALLDEYAALIEARERWRHGAVGDPALSEVRQAVRFQVAERDLRREIGTIFDQRVALREVIGVVVPQRADGGRKSSRMTLPGPAMDQADGAL